MITLETGIKLIESNEYSIKYFGDWLESINGNSNSNFEIVNDYLIQLRDNKLYYCFVETFDDLPTDENDKIENCLYFVKSLSGEHRKGVYGWNQTDGYFEISCPITLEDVIGLLEQGEYVTKTDIENNVNYTGDYTVGNTYKPNNLFKHNDNMYFTETEFIAADKPDLSKVYILKKHTNDDLYDHFEIEIDMLDVNPSKSNGKIVYKGGCENFTLSDWENWFGYKPVVMKVQENTGELDIIHECNPLNYKQSIDGVDLTQYIGDATQHKYHAFIQYPRRGYKIHYDYNSKKATIFLTNDPCDKNYSYYAFDYGGISNSNLYVATYPSTINRVSPIDYGVSVSSGNLPKKEKYSLINFRNAYNNTSKYIQNYGYYENIYMQIMHIAHFGNIKNTYPFEGWGSETAVCGCGDLIGMNGGGTIYNAVKIFGLEIHFGNWEWVDGAKTDDSNCLYLNNTNNMSNPNAWEYICKLNSCDGYVGNNIVWNEKVGVLAINTDSTNDKYFNTDHNYVFNKNMLKNTYNMFNVTMNQSENYSEGTVLISRMVYKR